MDSFLRRRVLRPMCDLMRTGVSPRKLAWSLALGVVVGVNPLLGSTSVVALLVAAVFRVNIVATQVSNHLVYPFELLLFPVFIKAGSLLFKTPGLPMQLQTLLHMAQRHPWELTKVLWRWEWHALVVWAALGCLAAPVLALLLQPCLEYCLRLTGGGTSRLQKN